MESNDNEHDDISDMFSTMMSRARNKAIIESTPLDNNYFRDMFEHAYSKEVDDQNISNLTDEPEPEDVSFEDWIEWLRKSPANIGRQSGNRSLNMTIRDDHFYNWFDGNEPKKRKSVNEFIKVRENSDAIDEEFFYWKYAEKLPPTSLEDIINEM